MFDYKFMLIIILSMILYFLYRRIETVEHKLKELDNSNTKSLSLNEEEDGELLELPLPEPEGMGNNDSSSNSGNEPDNDSLDIVNLPFNSDGESCNIQLIEQHQVEQQPVEQQPDETIHVNVDLNNDADNTLEEYSNEQSDIQIYSNDNEEEHHSSLMESMVEAVNENSDEKLSDLLKNNKLAELQEIAENLKINIHKQNNKKKTKLELAKDILSVKINI